MKPECLSYIERIRDLLQPIMLRYLNESRDATSLRIRTLFKDTLQINRYSRRTLRLVHKSIQQENFRRGMVREQMGKVPYSAKDSCHIYQSLA